ncbi:hypothetical protein DFJ58DRAFT_5893, partial [Suillus subalutaceus]|uniref:uncharacterized protein n=1 Tax=Suillus subalutaceus TaxID=48586 RepID=UPI001B870BCC
VVTSSLTPDTLDLPCQCGTARYRLKGIIYSGSEHFTARLIAENVTWTYDGQINGVRSRIEGISTDFPHLRELDGREAHLCGYALHYMLEELHINGVRPVMNSGMQVSRLSETL